MPPLFLSLSVLVKIYQLNNKILRISFRFYYLLFFPPVSLISALYYILPLGYLSSILNYFFRFLEVGIQIIYLRHFFFCNINICPSQHCFCVISHTLIYCIFISTLFFGFSIFFEIFFLTNGLFRNVLFNFQMFGDFPVVFLLLFLVCYHLVREHSLYDFSYFRSSFLSPSFFFCSSSGLRNCLSSGMSHGCLKKMSSLLLLGAVLYIVQLDPVNWLYCLILPYAC